MKSGPSSSYIYLCCPVEQKGKPQRLAEGGGGREGFYNHYAFNAAETDKDELGRGDSALNFGLLPTNLIRLPNVG
jgi:hypothetical protein